jgi:hypothetical protein
MLSICMLCGFPHRLRTRGRGYLIATALLIAFLATGAAALEPPPNWSAQAGDGAEVFAPSDLQEGEVLHVTVFPHAPLDGGSLETWAKQFAGSDAPPPGGKWSAVLDVVPKAAQLVTATREWSDANGKRGVVMYTASSFDARTARIVRLTANISPALKRHSDAAQALMSAAATEKSGAPAKSAARAPVPPQPSTPPSEPEAVPPAQPKSPAAKPESPDAEPEQDDAPAPAAKSPSDEPPTAKPAKPSPSAEPAAPAPKPVAATGPSDFESPAGWMRVSGEGAEIHQPEDLRAGELMQVAFYPRTPMGAQSVVEAWLRKRMAEDTPPQGKWAGAVQAQRVTDNAALGSRTWRDAQDKQGSAVYSAVSLDGVSVRVARLVENGSAATQRHKQAAMTIMGQLLAQEKRAARAEGRAGKVEALPPPVEGIQPGGPIVPGLYVGNYIADRKDVLYRLDVMLFANGEYDFVGHRDSAGTIRYSEATGKLDLKDPLWNNIYHPKRDFCIYGRDEKGEPVIYSQDLACCGGYRIELRRVADVDRDPPSVAKQKKEAERAEAVRYKFVTEPGKGIAAKDIEALAHRWEQVSVVWKCATTRTCC